MKRVVVTGIGAITPIGIGRETFKKALMEGVSGAELITLFDASEFKTRFACEVKGFDPSQILDRREIRRMDRFSHFAMCAADEAILDSGIDLDSINLDRAGVIYGSGVGGLGSVEIEIESHTRGNGIPRYNPFVIPKLIPDIAAGLISIKYGFRGVNYCTVSACASSSHAAINSFDYIRLGKADIILTGGSEAAVVKPGIGGFNAMKALSTRNDDPSTASRPFDLNRDGFVLGEGGGALILESLEHAKKRGAKIYAEIVGSGMTADAYHMTAPHPEGLGARNVMNLAIQDAQLNKEDVDYINVHGTSTPLGDIAEINAIMTVFGNKAFDLNISSTKSMTGHLLGAAGAIELISCVFAINENVVPPTINHFEDDPKIDKALNLTFNTAQERNIDVAICNTFGFGGHNASLVIKSYKE